MPGQHFGAPRTGRPWLLLAGLVAYAVTYIAFYPPAFAIIDEDAYLSQALLFRSGQLTYDVAADLAPHQSAGAGGRLSSKYPPGNSLFLLPFVLPGWRFAFVSGLVLALVGTLLFGLTLRRLAPGADPAWALAWLCYPAVVVYSRTVMSDLLCATLTLAAFYCLLRSGRWLLWAGLALGWSVLVRYSNAVLLPVFLALALAEKGQGTGDAGRGSEPSTQHPVPRAQSFALLLSGFAPFAALALAYNRACYGGAFAFPMHLTTVFSASFVPGNIVMYGSSLLAVYPLMLAGPLLAGRRLAFWLGLPAATLLVFYCFVPHPNPGLDFAGRSITGLRYLLPAVPFLLLGWCCAADRVTRPLVFSGTLRAALAILLVAGGLFLQVRHQRLLREQDTCRQALLSAVPPGAYLLCNVGAAELLSPAWGTRPHRLFIEHNVPVELVRAPPDAETLYAALRARPGRAGQVEAAVFAALVAGYPGRVAVGDSSACGLRLFRLKP